MERAWLIAWREIKAYAGTLSFWLALVAGPALMLLAALMIGPIMHARPVERIVAVEAADPHLAALAAASLSEAGALAGRPVRIGLPAAAETRIVIVERAGRLVVDSRGAGLSRLDWALLRRDLADGRRGDAVRLRQAAASGPARAPAAAGRFALVLLLWMNLVGSLGMLLQAIVRERANRALEILLTSARPAEILAGKLIGVAALSVAVVAGWMAIGGLAMIAPGAQAAGGRGLSDVVSSMVGGPERLALVAAVYVLAFAMYGGAILGLSALSKDMPAAQNASRPLFGLLLLGFFAAIGMISDPGALAWLQWVPPLTPFVLLMQDPAALGAGAIVGALALMAAATALTFMLAAKVLEGRFVWRARPFARRRGPAPAVTD